MSVRGWSSPPSTIPLTWASRWASPTLVPTGDHPGVDRGLSRVPRGRLAAGDPEHDLATLAPLSHAVERRPGIGEREHGVDLRPDCAFVGKPCELDELVAVRLDDEVGDAGCLLDDGDDAAGPNRCEC